MTDPLTRPSTLGTALRNAYEAHDHDEFHRLLARIEPALKALETSNSEARWHTCRRGNACVCAPGPQRATCLYRGAA